MPHHQSYVLATSHGCVSWICLLHLIPSISLFFCIAYQLGLASIGKLSPGSQHACHHASSWSLSTQLLLLSLLSVSVSVRGPLLFILHTTTLCSLISDSSVGHHMCVGDNKFFMSYVTSELCTKISNLRAYEPQLI